ncbi:MAG: rhomboid family intramembrane serine protease [Myxococcales bacterium]|nr:rhomboid family intramembrane serine protease [Myxococcales bacterium]
MVANFAVWLLVLVAAVWFHIAAAIDLYNLAALHPAWQDPQSVTGGYVWQLFTYMWLHDLGSPLHLLFNMLMLWLFGSHFEEKWGPRAFLQFYLLCGVGAAVFTVLLALAAPSLFGAPVVGASGALLGFISAFARIYPERKVYLWLAIPVSGKHLLWLTIGIDLLFFLSLRSQLAFATHLGGLLTGYLLVTGWWRPQKLISMIQTELGRRRRKSNRLRVVKPDTENKTRYLN